MQRSIAMQRRLIDDLLDLSRIIAGTVRLEVERVRLLDVVATAVATVEAASARRCNVEVAAAAAAFVVGDAARLQQVVANLVSNAFKFTPPDGRVEVRVERVDDRARIVVTDTGRGIASDAFARVFDEFEQARAPGDAAHGGLGLGLAIVRRLVELHGGTVRATSDGPGRGAPFVVELPGVQREHVAGAARGRA